MGEINCVFVIDGKDLVGREKRGLGKEMGELLKQCHWETKKDGI